MLGDRTHIISPSPAPSPESEADPTRRGRASESTGDPSPVWAHPVAENSSAPRAEWLRMDTFVQSAPNPGWSVRAVDLRDGRVLSAEGRGHASLRAAQAALREQLARG